MIMTVKELKKALRGFSEEDHVSVEVNGKYRLVLSGDWSHARTSDGPLLLLTLRNRKPAAPREPVKP